MSSDSRDASPAELDIARRFVPVPGTGVLMAILRVAKTETPGTAP